MILWRKTKAWVEVFGPRLVGVRINRAAEFAEGIVEEDEYAKLRAEIASQILSLKDPDGGALVREVKTREDVFSGPYAKTAPDLIVFLHPQYTLRKSVGKALRSRDLVTPITNPVRDGNHEPAGVYIATFGTLRTLVTQ